MQNILHCDFYIFIVNGDTGKTSLTKFVQDCESFLDSHDQHFVGGKNPMIGTLPEQEVDSVSSLGRYQTTQS